MQKINDDHDRRYAGGGSGVSVLSYASAFRILCCRFNSGSIRNLCRGKQIQYGIFYGCFPIRKWEYVVGRSITCLLVMTIPSVISVGFIQIGMHGSFCRIEEVRAVTEAFGQYQMLIICAMIMLGFIGGANLLLAAFAGKVESREMLEVLFLLLEGVVAAGILFLIQKTVYHGNAQEFLKAFQNLTANHEGLSCFLFILVGLIALLACTLISLRTIRGKRG